MAFEYSDDTCPKLWNGLYITPNGSVRLCCMSRERVHNVEVFIDDIEDLQEYFNTKTDRYENFRTNKLCSTCTNAERIGKPSHRNGLKTTYSRIGLEPSEDCIIKHLDVTFNNICNQQCLMCNSEYSSKWYAYDKADTEFNRKSVKYRNWCSPGNMAKIKKLIPQLKLINIRGGEPTIQKEVFDFLKMVIEVNPDVHVVMLSNFMQVSDEMMDLLCSLRNLQLSLSIDSTGEMHNWTRGGDFDASINNLRRYVAGTKFPNFVFCNTINRWSVHNIVHDIKTMAEIVNDLREGRDWDISYNMLLCTGPWYTSAHVLPRTERLNIVNEFEREFGIIDPDKTEIMYNNLRVNHVNTLLTLEDDVFDDALSLSHSDKWGDIISGIRQAR